VIRILLAKGLSLAFNVKRQIIPEMEEAFVICISSEDKKYE
jgi:hypothetical protein